MAKPCLSIPIRALLGDPLGGGEEGVTLHMNFQGEKRMRNAQETSLLSDQRVMLISKIGNQKEEI